MNSPKTFKLTSLALALSLGALAACSNDEPTDAQGSTASSIAEMKQDAKDTGEAVKDEAKQAIKEGEAAAKSAANAVKEETHEASKSLKESANKLENSVKAESAEVHAQASKDVDKMKTDLSDGTDAVSIKVHDAAITASVNASLAKDPELSALKIDVDTSNGTVYLSGIAPDRDARRRASRIAESVEGVKSVENHLEIQG